MEGNGNDIQVAARRFWNIVRGMLLVLRKNISKKKRLTTFDFDIILKRGKNILHNLAFHHNHSHNNNINHINEYEFSCSDTPARVFPFPFHLTGKRNKNINNSHILETTPDDDHVVSMMSGHALLESPAMTAASLYANNSPALPGFGRTPLARQLRVTDSPYPIHDLEESYHVDKAAEEFIVKFYQHLRKQQDHSMANTKRNF